MSVIVIKSVQNGYVDITQVIWVRWLFSSVIIEQFVCSGLEVEMSHTIDDALCGETCEIVSKDTCVYT